MLKQIRRHRYLRVLCAAAPLALAACAQPSRAASSLLEVSAAPSRGLGCAAAGELLLEGVDHPALALVTDRELCSGSPVRRELPPGLYRLSWRGAAQSAPGAGASPLQGPAVVSLLPRQATRLRVSIESSADSIAAASSDRSMPEPSAPACTHYERPSGAS